MVKKDKHIKPGYHLTEVGIIPTDWEVKDLWIIGKIVMWQSPLSKYYNSYWAWLPLIQGNADLKNRQTIKRNHTRQVTKFWSKWSIILTVRAPVGEVWIATFDCCLWRGVCSIDYPNGYLFQYLIFLENSWQRYSTWSTFDSINWEQIKSIKIALPLSKPEQSAIAKALSDTDTLISSLDELIEKKVQIRDTTTTALLKWKMRLPGFEKLSWVKESILWIIPNDWNVKPLPEVVVHIHWKAHEKHIEKYWKYIVVNSKFISTDWEIRKYSNENFCPAKINDVLTVLSDLPNGKALAKCFYVEENNQYAVNQRVCIWRSKWDHSKYLHYILNRNAYFLGLNDGVSQTHILNHHIQKCPLLIPSDINEQIAIAKVISDMDLEISELEKKRDKYKQIKQGMMTELLTGNIRLLWVK